MSVPLVADVDWLGRPAPVSMTVRRRDRDREFEEFFLAQFASVASSVAFVCGDTERANDATQEAFIRAYGTWGKIRRMDNPATWVRRIAINATRDTFRSDTRRSLREARSTAPNDRTAPEPEHAPSTLELLAGLPDRQRAIAALYYLDDLPTAEISEVLGIAEGTIRFHLSQARATLRTQLESREEADRA